MFNGNLGFNPFDKSHDVYAKSHAVKRAKFISSFGNPNIFCYNGNPRKKISSMNHTDSLDESLQANISNDSDVYFYVNGGRKQYAINTVRACFVDLDAGRDSTGQYLKAKEVLLKKREFLDQINSFPVKPSWIIDTRNGYQIYWLLDQKSQKITTKTTWNGIQKKLANYFSADVRAIKINQIYRVPYTWWRKCWEKKQPYFTSILEGSNGDAVSILDLKSALIGQPATINVVPDKCSDEWYNGWAAAYKKADETGIPVSASAATEILNDLKQKCTASFNEDYRNPSTDVWKTYGEPKPVYRTDRAASYSRPSVEPASEASDHGLIVNESQAKLLKTAVEFLNQASTALYFSNNRFLASAAKDIASKISDQFCIG